jgi:hypothetical protein
VKSFEFLKQVLEHTSETPELIGANESSRKIICPIPFFGNLDFATILTVGVNPSDGEFTPTRWPHNISLEVLHERLKNYFSHPCPAHKWFDGWKLAFREIGETFSYEKERAAHIDLSPRVTVPMSRVPDRSLFIKMLESDIHWLFKAIECNQNAKLIMVGGKVLRKLYVAKWIGLHAPTKFTFKYINNGVGLTCFYLLETSERKIPIFSSHVSPTFKQALVQNVYTNRNELRRFLR